MMKKCSQTRGLLGVSSCSCLIQKHLSDTEGFSVSLENQAVVAVAPTSGRITKDCSCSASLLEACAVLVIFKGKVWKELSLTL